MRQRVDPNEQQRRSRRRTSTAENTSACVSVSSPVAVGRQRGARHARVDLCSTRQLTAKAAPASSQMPSVAQTRRASREAADGQEHADHGAEDGSCMTRGLVSA